MSPNGHFQTTKDFLDDYISQPAAKKKMRFTLLKMNFLNVVTLRLYIKSQNGLAWACPSRDLSRVTLN